MNRKTYEQELDQLKTEFIQMCRATEHVIEKSIQALMQKDIQLAEEVAGGDGNINEYELRIEKMCLRLLLKQQPVAKDFREVSSALKMITDIERIADQAADIAEIVVSLEDTFYNQHLEHIENMGVLAINMVRRSVNSFVDNDVQLAKSTIQLDDELDRLFDIVKQELVELIRKENESIDTAIALMMIAKYLERIGDHAVNICEWVSFFETGIHEKY